MKINEEAYKIIYFVGKTMKLCSSNILIEDIDDFKDVEYWERRLKNLKQDFTVTFKRVGTRNLYTIFCGGKKKRNAFKCIDTKNKEIEDEE